MQSVEIRSPSPFSVLQSKALHGSTDSYQLPQEPSLPPPSCEGFLLPKIRCYGCGKVFRNRDVTRYREFLAREKPKPYNIHEDPSEPYENKVGDFLTQELGLVRPCCRMHFFTPYQFSRGMDIHPPGLIHQRNADLEARKEVVQDPLGEITGGVALAAARKPPGRTQFLDLKPGPHGPMESLPKTRAQLNQETRQVQKTQEMLDRTTMDVDQSIQDIVVGDISEMEEPEEQEEYVSPELAEGRLDYQPIVEGGSTRRRKR